MTLKELSQLYYLNREIEMDKDRLKVLRAKAESMASPLSDMPKGRNAESRIERYVADIADLDAIIFAKQTQCVHERNRLERYIADIDDSLTRQIFTYRFVSCLKWDEIAAKMGSVNTWKNLSNICYRHIKKSQNES